MKIMGFARSPIRRQTPTFYKVIIVPSVVNSFVVLGVINIPPGSICPVVENWRPRPESFSSSNLYFPYAKCITNYKCMSCQNSSIIIKQLIQSKCIGSRKLHIRPRPTSLSQIFFFFLICTCQVVHKSYTVFVFSI